MTEVLDVRSYGQEQDDESPTPTPWVFADTDDCTHCRFFDKELGEVVQMSFKDQEFATHAANCHDALLEACKGILDMISRMPVGHHFPDDVDIRCDAVRDAIEKTAGAKKRGAGGE